MAKQEPKQAELEALRARIDEIDLEILAALNRRARIAQDVGATKERSNAAVFRPEREAQVLARLAEHNQGPLSDDGVAHIYREIMSACRALERTLVVAYLGPRGTFSEQALRTQFGQSVEASACASIEEIFRKVETSAADYGVVPVENSSEGVVGQSLDLLLATNLVITAEIGLKIEHHLWSKGDAALPITRICAHSQALAQCARWLNSHYPGIERVAVSSNGEAARLAASEPGVAAVAGEIAGSYYGLQALAHHIQDDVHNMTRFAILGREESAPSGRDHTSLIVSVPNQPGAVYDILGPLKHHGVSMTRFESRPARMGVWSYYFYIDVAGHRSDPSVAAALHELQSMTGFYKLLGSYPVS